MHATKGTKLLKQLLAVKNQNKRFSGHLTTTVALRRPVRKRSKGRKIRHHPSSSRSKGPQSIVTTRMNSYRQLTKQREPFSRSLRRIRTEPLIVGKGVPNDLQISKPWGDPSVAIVIHKDFARVAEVLDPDCSADSAIGHLASRHAQARGNLDLVPSWRERAGNLRTKIRFRAQWREP